MSPLQLSNKLGNLKIRIVLSPSAWVMICNKKVFFSSSFAVAKTVKTNFLQFGFVVIAKIQTHFPLPLISAASVVHDEQNKNYMYVKKLHNVDSLESAV